MGHDANEWRWTFHGFESLSEGRPVQVWFDGLPEDHRSEIAFLLMQLENVKASLWRRPEFDPLDGAGGISEIIIPDIRDSSGVTYYRIYGYFGPGEHKYTFLHGTDKDVKNDIEGKKIARDQLGKIERGEAGIHKFAF
jgi:hypothetical protein